MFRILLRGDPVALVGIVMSVAMSLLLDVTDAASGVESLLAGLAGSTLSLVLDSLVRAERRFQLRSALEAAPWFGEAIQPIAECTRDIVKRYPNTLIVAEAQQRYDNLRESLAELSRGRVERDGTDYHYLMVSTDQARQSIQAVTNIAPGSDRLAWWRDDIGRHYWEANLAALARGVRITRVFAYTELTPPLEALIREHADAGVETIGVLRRRISEELQMNFVVWDGCSAWEARLNASGSIVANIFTINPHEVTRLLGYFKRLSLATSRVG
jgi:hypothetical protein